MPNWNDIKQFTRSATYVVDQPWDHFFNDDGALKKWINQYGLNIDPDFQRAHVWTERQQIRFIEYVLKGGRSGRELHFNHPGWMGNWKGEFVLVDGKQRLQAATRFFNNEIVIFDKWKFEDFEGRLGTEVGFKVHVNDLRTRAEVLQWYIDLNAGGVVHTEDEIEKVRQLLKEEEK